VFITVHDRSYAFVPVRERSWIDEPLWTGSDAKTIPTVSRWHSIPHSYTSSAAYCDDDARFLRLGTQVPLANHKYSLFVISATKKAKGLLGSSESPEKEKLGTKTFLPVTPALMGDPLSGGNRTCSLRRRWKRKRGRKGIERQKAELRRFLQEGTEGGGGEKGNDE